MGRKGVNWVRVGIAGFGHRAMAMKQLVTSSEAEVQRLDCACPPPWTRPCPNNGRVGSCISLMRGGAARGTEVGWAQELGSDLEMMVWRWWVNCSRYCIWGGINSRNPNKGAVVQKKLRVGGLSLL